MNIVTLILYTPDAIQGTRDTSVDKVITLLEFAFQWDETDNKQGNIICAM